MLNPNNRITVFYPNGAVRTRNCQSTVCPTKREMGVVNNIDDWFRHLAFKTDTVYGASARYKAELALMNLIDEANEIINENNY